ncbi:MULTISPECIES: AraC family transcriptional regulator [unclassified Amycolatopsis]|uniref:AraC family transcriptional regulator n=1 Tax=unclassified Amycolatopsis TaxID=2618356 RepID=UPI00026278F1|nr:AraC family transcriptional regulator [Amycolatopsis sp. ATCC 39116]
MGTALELEFTDLLRRHARPDLSTPLDGVRICRIDDTVAPSTSMSGTVLAVIAQGGKRLAVANRVYEYRAGQYLVAPVNLPVTGHVFDSTRENPTLGFGLTLEPAAIAELLLTAGPGDLPRTSGPVQTGMVVGTTSADLLDAIVRLLRLLDRPQDRRALFPVYKREILWRLMTGQQGEVVRQLGLADSSLNQIARAAQWIRENYQRTFRVEDLAQMASTSVSAFHRNFQAVTSMSPIQFQKHVRLQAARLMLLNEPHDVTGVAHRVGYGSVSQFSREYRRQFGSSPSTDAARFRHAGPQPARVALP